MNCAIFSINHLGDLFVSYNVFGNDNSIRRPKYVCKSCVQHPRIMKDRRMLPRRFMMKKYLVFLVFFAAFSVEAAIIRIPEDQPNIQTGIVMASASDTVLVSDGTYTGDGNRNIDFLNKAITVMSENGPSMCIINCYNSARGFIFQYFEGPESVIDGFTIINADASGYSETGAGVYGTNGVSPTITHCIFRNGNAYWRGVAMYFENGGSPFVSNCSFIDNYAGSGGAVIAAFNSQIKISGCNFNENGISSVYVYQAQAVIEDCTFNGNVGGVGLSDTTNSLVHNCVFNQNGNNPAYGSALVIYGSNNQVSSCSFTCNYGSAFEGDGCMIINCIFVGNTAELGGAIKNGYSPTMIKNCDFIENTALSFGGAVYCDNAASVSISDSIFRLNSAPQGSQLSIHFTSTLTISYSDVEGGQTGVDVETGSTLNWGGGMIDLDPNFVSVDPGYYYLSQIAAGQGSDSPCADSGSEPAANICFSPPSGTPVCMSELYTRTDFVTDSGQIDMGVHYPAPAVQTCIPYQGPTPTPTPFGQQIAPSTSFTGNLTLIGVLSFIILLGFRSAKRRNVS
jgi:predicted outer membrane repeat protein